MNQITTAGINSDPVGRVIGQLHVQLFIAQIDAVHTLVREQKLITEVGTLTMELQKP